MCLEIVLCTQNNGSIFAVTISLSPARCLGGSKERQSGRRKEPPATSPERDFPPTITFLPLELLLLLDDYF
jgi:hypothetical protein